MDRLLCKSIFLHALKYLKIYPNNYSNRFEIWVLLHTSQIYVVLIIIELFTLLNLSKLSCTNHFILYDCSIIARLITRDLYLLGTVRDVLT